MELEKSGFKGFSSLFSVQKDGSRTKAEAFDSTLNQQFALQEEINSSQQDHRLRPRDEKAGDRAEVDTGEGEGTANPQDERRKEVAEALGVEPAVVEALAQEYPLLQQFIQTGEVPEVVDGETLVDGALSPAALLALGAQVEEQLTASGQANRGQLRQAAESILQSLQASLDGEVPEDVVKFLQKNFGPLSAEVVEEVTRGQTVSRPNSALVTPLAPAAVQQVAEELVAFIDEGGRSASNLADIRAAADRILSNATVSASAQNTGDDALGQQLANGAPDQSAAVAAAAAQAAARQAAAQQAAARGAGGFQQAVAEAPAPAPLSTAAGTASQGQQQAEQAQAKNAPQQAARQAPHQPVQDQIAIQIRRAVDTGQDKISIRLNPSELGRIDVEMTRSADGQIQAVIKAEKSDTLDLLMRDARHLERAMADAGLKLDNSALSFQLASGGAGGEGQQGDGGNNEMAAFVGNEVFDDEMLSEDMMLGIDGDGFEFDEDGQHVSIVA
ncbi:MAG: flagellar hook-length control protein FliK [Pseudomonadota bacterium]